MLRKLSLVCVVAMALGAGLAHAAPPMPKEMPSDVLVLLEVANIQVTAARIKELITKVEPNMAQRIPPVEMVLPMGLLKTGAADSVDLTKPLRALILAPPLHTEPVLVFSVKDANAYLGGIIAEKKGVVDGVNEFDRFAVKIVGNLGVFSKNTLAVKKAAAIVAKAKLGDKPLLTGGDICIGARVAGSVGAFKEVGMDPFLMAKGGLALLAMGAGNDPQALAQIQQMQKMATHALGTLEELTAQIDSFGLAFKFDKNAIVVSETWLPVKDTDVAKFMNATPAGDFKMAKHLPADSAAFLLMRVSDPKPLLDWYGGLIAALGDAEANPQAVASIKKMFDVAATAFGGELGESVSFRPAATMLVAYAASVKDAAAARTFAQQGAKLADLVADLQPAGAPKTRIKMTPDALKYKGVGIDKFTFDITIPPNPNMPPALAAIPKELIKRLLGDAGYSAVLKDAAISTLGSAGAEDGIRAAIDGKNSLAASGKVRKALIGVRGKPVMVASADVSACLNWGIELVRAMQPDLPIPPEIKMGKSTPLTCTMVVARDGVVASQLRIPHDIITSIADMVKPLIPMGAGPGPGRLPGPPPMPPGERDFPAPPE